MFLLIHIGTTCVGVSISESCSIWNRPWQMRAFPIVSLSVTKPTNVASISQEKSRTSYLCPRLTFNMWPLSKFASPCFKLKLLTLYMLQNPPKTVNLLLKFSVEYLVWMYYLSSQDYNLSQHWKVHNSIFIQQTPYEILANLLTSSWKRRAEILLIHNYNFLFILRESIGTGIT